MHLLYVADHAPDNYTVKALREAGHVVEATGEPPDGVEMARAGGYQAIVLDWSVPPADCVARFSLVAREALILVIVAPGDDGVRAAVLQDGADACFVRPIQFIELHARLEALARLVQRARPRREAAEMIVAERAVRISGRSIALSGLEFRLMGYLIDHAGEVIGPERLHQQVWGDAGEARPDLVRAVVTRLRRKLDGAGAQGRLRAIAGHGYVFAP
jgi:DNA-binding response OmpR family regulator